MMWELISANKKRSIMLFAGMALCLLVLGYFIGVTVYGDEGGIGGVFIALGIWGFLAVISVFGGGSILLATSKAHEIKRDMHPRLFNIVEEMKIASALPSIPKIYIIDDPAPNAFATGFKPEKSAIAVTTGLLSRLNRDELQGVVAHEMSHIMNRDVQFMTLAGVMLGSIVLISEIFLRSLWFAPRGGRRSRVSTKGGGQAQLIIIIVAVAVAILAPVFARLLYFAISRKREYLADASAARLTRYPEGLASALEKIALTPTKLSAANKVTAPMYIVNPFTTGASNLANLSSTHPPIEERIKILRTMAGGAGYLNYQRAYSKIKGKPSMIIPGSGLKQDEKVPVREASKEDVPVGKESTRSAIDLMRAVSGYAFLVCACGLKIKVPPNFAKPSIKCPRCGRINELPVAILAGVEAAIGASGKGGIIGGSKTSGKTAPGPLEYARRGTGWESFHCSCGKLLQISPAFCGKTITCRHCGRITKIVSKSA